MPTSKPRITITLDENVNETVSRLAALQGTSKASVITALLESVHQPLMRTVALLDAAQQAPSQVQQNLYRTIQDMEREVTGDAGKSIAQMDWLLQQINQETAGGGGPGNASGRATTSGKKGKKKKANPRVVTRGSGRGGSRS